MTAAIAGIAPFFIVSNVPKALAYNRDQLGFAVTLRVHLPTTSISAL